MTNQDLIDALRAAEAVQFGEFELSHGGTSEYYVDKYLFETDPDCLELVAEAFADRLSADDKLGGVALVGCPRRRDERRRRRPLRHRAKATQGTTGRPT